MVRTRISPDLCTGCRTCELVCSFHFTKAFSRKAGAIEVRRDEPEGIFDPIIHEKPNNLRKGCDLCAGEDTLLCAKYCAVGAIEITKE